MDARDPRLGQERLADPGGRGTTELVLRLAAGRFDRLSGRLLTAGTDLDQLDSMADELIARDALVLRLRD